MIVDAVDWMVDMLVAEGDAGSLWAKKSLSLSAVKSDSSSAGNAAVAAAAIRGN